MSRGIRSITLLLLPTFSASFLVNPSLSYSPTRGALFATEPESSDENDENDGLILDGLGKEMAKMSTKYSFSESDFLAAARKRAEMKVESSNAGASDEEWQSMANQKKEQYGEVDDWENSKKEAGNVDSQILMFTEPSNDGSDGEDGEDKLLLF